MLRALLSAVVIVSLAGMAFYLYSSFLGPGKKAANWPNITAEGTPPAAPRPSKPAPNLPPPPVAPTPPAPVVEPQPPPAPSTPAPQAPKLKRTHIVQPGESLSSISRRYYGTPERYGKIVAANNLRSRDVIRVGQVLVIPEGSGPPVIESTNDENEERAASTAGTQEFEPQPPTLNTTGMRDEGAPKK